MRHSSDFFSSPAGVVARSAILIVSIGLMEWPQGWMGLVYLVPVVVGAFVLRGWHLAGAGAVSILLSQVFHAGPWIPHPATVLLIASVFGIALQAGHVRSEGLHRNEHEAEQERRTFFDNSPAAILIADGAGKIVLANKAAQNLLGFEDQPLTGQGLASCLPALASALRIERANQVFHTITECKGWRPNGEVFIADAWFSIDKTPLGPRLGAVVVDASERLEEREQWGLRSALTTSQIAIGAVLHEIRNLCAAATLMHANLERVPNLRKNEDFEALGSLVGALAKIASAELRAGESLLTSVDVGAVLDQLRLIIDPWFRRSEMSIDWDIASDLPRVWAEGPGLLQIFLNLAQNSNKAMSSSEQKRLTISASVEGDSVLVRFRDTGPGVTAPDEMFRPLHNSAGVKRLGLYVSRAIAHSFSGELRSEPSPVGSCFAVELLSLRAWQKEEVEYGDATSDYQNSSG